jgi:hypothetical protein
MSDITQQPQAGNPLAQQWDRFCESICFIIAFIAAPPVDMDGIREPVVGSLLGGNNIITAAVAPTSASSDRRDGFQLEWL